MKKIIAFGIVAALAACGGSKKSGTTTPDNKGSAAGSAMGGQGYAIFMGLRHAAYAAWTTHWPIERCASRLLT